MSVMCIEFLQNSFLWDNRMVDTGYFSVDERDLFDELQKYRENVLSNISEIQEGIHNDISTLNVCIESFTDLPTEQLYKQLALYVDQIVIPDPLFELTEVKPGITSVFSTFMGVSNSENINRSDVANAVLYIKSIYLLITSNLVKLLPISLIHEAPKELPITYSETGFRDVLPPHIREFYSSIVKVCNMERKANHLRLSMEEPLRPGTGIYVFFPDEDRRCGFAYQFMRSEVLNIDKQTGKFEFRSTIPDSISEMEFIAWVNQSINQASIKHFEEKYNELLLAKKVGCMYLSRSQLTANILSMSIKKPTPESQMATMAMKLDLPVFSKISLADIISIRQNEGEAFHNFRSELNSKLISIRGIEDPKELRMQLDTISYEMNTLQVRDVEKEYRKIKRTLGIDATVLTGSLLASFVTGGLTLVGAAAAVAKGVLDSSKYFADVREHNGFFLWKLNKQASKNVL